MLNSRHRMRRFILSLLCAFLALEVAGQTVDPDRAADPLFTGERYKPTKPTQESSQPSAWTDGPDRLRYELTGFARGNPFHLRARTFVDVVARDVASRLGRGVERIERIVVTGFADGLPNAGVTRHSQDSFPPQCREGVSVPIDDDELAALRGCIVMQYLKPRIPRRFAGGATWRSDSVNIKDGGDAGDPFRKVTIVVIFESRK